MKRGFTLIELIVALAGGLLILLGLMHLFSLEHAALTRGGSLAEIVQNGRIALERMSRELRQAEQLVTSLPATSPGASQVSFQDGHDANALNYLRYYVAGNALRRERSYYSLTAAPTVHVHYYDQNPDGSAATKVITEDEIIAEYIQSLSLWGSPLMSVSLGLSQKTSTTTITTTLYARNLH